MRSRWAGRSQEGGQFDGALVFVNKTYIKDLHYSLNLYRSFLQYYCGSGGFYVVIAASETEAFTEAFMANFSHKMPIFITEEEVLAGNNIALEGYLCLSGHERQQVIKLGFYKVCQKIFQQTGQIASYITLDSDIEITRKFNDDIFFWNMRPAWPKNWRARKTLCTVSNGGVIPLEWNKNITRIVGDSHAEQYFVDAFGLWSVEVMEALDLHVRRAGVRDFCELITLAPCEAQWYGAYLYNHFHERFAPMRGLFRGVAGFIGNDCDALHTKESVYNRCASVVARQRRRGSYGLYIHYATTNRSGYTFYDLCQEFKSGV